jgi:hypothetical protein
MCACSLLICILPYPFLILSGLAHCPTFCLPVCSFANGLTIISVVCLPYFAGTCCI